MWFVFWPSCIETQHHPHLSWAVCSHICAVWLKYQCSPTSCCGYRQSTGRCFAQIVSCLTHLETPPLTPEITSPPNVVKSNSSGLSEMVLQKKQDIVCKTHNPAPLLRQDLPHPELQERPLSPHRWVLFWPSDGDRERTVWGVSVSRGRVEPLPRWACSVPPSWPLIGRSHGWGKEILPIGNNWCFVAGPSCPDTKLTFIGNKVAPQVFEKVTLKKEGSQI